MWLAEYDYPPPPPPPPRHNSITGLIFALLLAAIFAHLWFSSTPVLQPLGGPNAIIAAVAVLLASSYAVWRVVRSRERSADISALVKDFRPAIPVIAVSLLLALWMLAVYRFTDTLNTVLMGQTLLGIGVLFAVYRCVDSIHRAKLMALAIIAATLVSALWGMAVAFIGDPFLSVWLQIATVRDEDIYRILYDGRITGFVPSAGTFAHQLAVAIPFAFAALLCSPFGRGKAARRIYDAALFVILMTLLAAFVFNSSRALFLGLGLSAIIVILPSLTVPSYRRRLLFIVPLMALWLFAFFNPGYNVGGVSGKGSDISGRGGSDLPHISKLGVGIQTLRDRSDGSYLSYTIRGIMPQEVYGVQLRTRKDHASGPRRKLPPRRRRTVA